MLSPFAEWFPALTERRSLTTIQGSEWLSGSQNYNHQYDIVTKLHQCLYSDIDCVSSMEQGFSDFDFIVLSGVSGTPLASSLIADKDFTLIHQTGKVLVFQKN